MPFDATEKRREAEDWNPISGEVVALVKRKISENTCRKFGYRRGRISTGPVQIADYRDKDGNLVGQKIRHVNKQFTVLGRISGTLFGRHLWPSGGKRIVITEGEIDALSYAEVTGCRWPVVSIPNGSSGARKDIAANVDWLNSYEEVVFAFDSDEPGRKAAAECAAIIQPGKAKIAEFPMKDINEMLVNGLYKEITQAIYDAREYRPDGIVRGNELWDLVTSPDTYSKATYPWNGLNNILHGIRTSELVTVTAGSGVGKSAVVREIVKHLVDSGDNVGVMMLEESIKRTALGIMGLAINKPLHINRDGVTEEDLRKAYDQTLGTGRISLYDHFGSTDVDNILSRVRYMATALGCKWIIIDHLSILVSGMEGDERRILDMGMTRLRTLVQELDVGLILVSHLKRPEGRGHEEGAKTSLSQLRGSHAIAQLSDAVIGLERDQQGEEPDVTTVRVLKNRYSGETGEACKLFYDKSTGRITEYGGEFNSEEDPYRGDF